MIGIQIIAILFALWMTYFSYLHFRRGEFKLPEYVFWQVIWAGLVAIVIYPHSVRFILKAFSISRTFDLVVIIGFIIIFGVTFRNYVVVKRIEKKIEAVIRDQSLQGAQENNDRASKP